MRILAALLVLNVLILIHELGHFLVAKLTGVRVNEFAIGMGPRLFKWGKGETEYSVRALPIGGFCAMEGEDDGAPTPSAIGGNADRELPDAPDTSRSFAHKPVWKRILIVMAGAVMNLLLGFVLLLIINGFLLKPNTSDGKVLFPTTKVHSFAEEDASSYKTGLRAGDTIIEVNGRRIIMDTDLTLEMQNDKDGVLDMVVRRTVGGKQQEVPLKGVKFTRYYDATCVLCGGHFPAAVDAVAKGDVACPVPTCGKLQKVDATGKQAYLVRDFIVVGEERNFLNTIAYSAKQELSVATVVWRSLVDMIQGDYGLNDLSGPVGTVDIISEAVGNTVTQPDPMAAWRTLLMLMVMITVNLGVFNLLPLPALDGGRLVFLLWEGITRKPVPPKWEGIIHLVGIALLLLLMLVVTYSDITKFFA